MEKLFLLTDDDNDDAEMFGEALSRIDAAIAFHHVTDGDALFQFLDNVENVMPDIIFLDVNMPKTSGWEWLDKLKAHNDYKAIPVIMYSTSSIPHDKEIAIESGALGFLTKANDFNVMIKELTIIVNTDSIDLKSVLQKLKVN